jgi:hypothetical protein
MFDHTIVLNNGDPLAENFMTFLHRAKINNVRSVPDCSCEGIAQFVYDLADSFVREQTDDRVRVSSVTVHEDSKNYATYEHSP